MNLMGKYQNKKAKTMLVVLFLAAGFLFFASPNARAAGVCENGTGDEKTCECFNGSTSLGLFPAGTDIGIIGPQLEGQTGFCNRESCMQYCQTKFPKGSAQPVTAVKFDGGGGLGGSAISIKNSSSAVEPAPSLENICAGGTTSIFNPLTWIRCALQGVLQLVGYLFAIAATLFAWAITPDNISGSNGMLNKQAVKDVWIMVRDLMNMSFILVLLFSAFCTIFQYDKWGLKKVWLNILINALLVNFSFPIARFIIDISNVTFYYFVNHLFSSTGTVTGSTILSSYSAASGLADLLRPQNYEAFAIPYLIATIVFVFVLGMTLLIIGALFIVRLVALTMIIMFSPIGFIGYAVPSWSSYADEWWKKLFSYSFFAPIMIFGMAVSLRIMQAIHNENMQSFYSNGGVNAGSDQSTWIAQVAFFIIPIIVLWSVIGVAQSSKIAMADTVVKNVKAGGKWMANTPWKATGIPGGFKQAKDYYGKRGIKLPGFKNRHFGSDQTEGSNAWVAQRLGVPNAESNDTLKKMGEASKEHNMEDMGPDALNRLAEKGSRYERLAALEQLAKNGDISQTQLKDVMDKFGDKNPISKRILSKVKEKSPHLALDYIPEADQAKFAKTFKAENLNNAALGDEKFMKLFIAAGKMDKKTFDGLTDAEKTTYQATVEKIAGSLSDTDTVNTKDKTVKSIHVQHFALTGKVEDKIKDKNDTKQKEMRAEIWKKLNKDNIGNIDPDTLRDFADEIAEHVNGGKLAEMAKELDKSKKGEFVRAIYAKADPDLKRQIDNDSFLKSFVTGSGATTGGSRPNLGGTSSTGSSGNYGGSTP